MIIFTLAACLFSLALGLEGARMMLVLFLPVTIIVGVEFFLRLFLHSRENSVKRTVLFRADRFPQYFTQAFLVCAFALVGFLVNQTILSSIYPFAQFDTLIPEVTVHSVMRTLFNQVELIGNGTGARIFSIALWAVVGVLIGWFLLRKDKKSTSTLRFLWICLASWACYVAFSCIFYIGQAPYHMIPVVVLFIPAVTVAIKETNFKSLLWRIICIGLSFCLLLTGLLGYLEFESWPYRNGEESNVAFKQIATVLEEKGYRNGYATPWNANVLTELSDGAIDVWCVEKFDELTIEHPKLDKWLQVKSHDTTRPTGKVFLVWTAKEYAAYNQEYFDYLGEILYRDDAFVVYEVIY